MYGLNGRHHESVVDSDVYVYGISEVRSNDRNSVDEHNAPSLWCDDNCS